MNLQTTPPPSYNPPTTVVNSSFRNKNKFYTLITGLIIIGIIAFLIFKFFPGLFNNLNKSVKLPGTISPDILSLTMPVFEIIGIVEKIEGSTIVISYQPATAMDLLTNPTQMPKPIPKISYKVDIAKDTVISQPFYQRIPFLFQTSFQADGQKLSIKDLKTGQNVTVRSKEDLRQIAGREFTASSIILPALSNTVQGKIDGIKDNIISLSSSVLMPIATQSGTTTKKYQVTVNDQTELTSPPKMMTDPIKPVSAEKLSLADFKVGTNVLVYTNVDVNTQTQFPALKIEPISETLLTPILPPIPAPTQ